METSMNSEARRNANEMFDLYVIISHVSSFTHQEYGMEKYQVLNETLTGRLPRNT